MSNSSTGLSNSKLTEVNGNARPPLRVQSSQGVLGTDTKSIACDAYVQNRLQVVAWIFYGSWYLTADSRRERVRGRHGSPRKKQPMSASPGREFKTSQARTEHTRTVASAVSQKNRSNLNPEPETLKFALSPKPSKPETLLDARTERGKVGKLFWNAGNDVLAHVFVCLGLGP